MEPVGFAAGVVTLVEVTEKLVTYSRSVKHAAPEKRAFEVEATLLCGHLTSLRYRVEDSSSDDPWFVQVRNLGVPNGPLDQFKEAVDKLAVKVREAHGLVKIGKALTWKLDKKEVEECLRKIERLKSLVNNALTEANFTLNLAIKQGVTSIEEGVSDIRRTQNAALYDDIHKWLQIPDPSSNHNLARKKHQDGTGAWFLESKDFIDWIEGKYQCLWLCGKPGCGKTILCSSILECLQRRQQTRKCATPFFYFDFKESSKQGPAIFLRSLIWQASSSTIDLFDRLKAFYDDHRKQQSPPSEAYLLSLFRQQVENLDECFIIIDALDECDHRNSLLTVIKAFLGWALPHLYILATGRPESDIEEWFNGIASKRKVCIESNVIKSDIRLYIDEQLQINLKLKRWPAPVQADIRETLSKGSNGMFRWVFCQLEALSKCIRLPQLESALRNLPNGLDETYQRILDEIPEEYHEDTERALQWLCFARRPLRLEEMADVFAVSKKEAMSFNLSHRLPDPMDITIICSSLVEVNIIKNPILDMESPITDSEDFFNILYLSFSTGKLWDSKGTVQLSHYSVQQYLERDRHHQKPGRPFKFDSITSHSEISRTSLLYLTNWSDDPGRSIEASGFPLLTYAAPNWFYHLRECEANDQLNLMAVNLLISDRLRTNLGKLRNIFRDRYIPRYIPSDAVSLPIDYASACGLPVVAKGIIAVQPDINASRSALGDALKIASGHGHLHMVQFLIETGADVNFKSNTEHALILASANGHLDTVHYLLAHGADTDIVAPIGGALHAACDSGHMSVVQSLIEVDADIDPEGAVFATVLWTASERGILNIVRRLTEKVANMKVKGEPYELALAIASSFGCLNIVQYLVAKGIDVNSQGKLGSPLEAALAHGHEEIAQFLRDHGARESAYPHDSDVELRYADSSPDSSESFDQQSCHSLSGGADDHMDE